ncbi:hypothetical protein GN958_ATG01016 [Phytophthora infestans]|nr:hypothetical protein GN958_ATG01016 [Phytophthora infestans]
MLHEFITPKLDVVTRWNSTWIMLDSLLRMKLPLNELLQRIELKEPPYTGFTIRPGDSLIKEITEESWAAVNTLYTFLEPIKEATDMSSASTYPTFGILLLTNHVIKFHAAETIEKSQDEHTKKFADAVKRKLDNYAPKLDKREARIATILDPRAKQHLDVLVKNVASVKQEVIDEFNQHYRAAFQAQQQSNRGPPSAQKKRANHYVNFLRAAPTRLLVPVLLGLLKKVSMPVPTTALSLVKRLETEMRRAATMIPLLRSSIDG